MIYAHYDGTVQRCRNSLAGRIVQAYFQGTLALHNRIQLDNVEAPHPWPMPCNAGATSIVIDYNGDVRACELRGKLGNLRDYGCDFGEFWESRTRKDEVDQIVRDQCWCTHVCFIHDSLRHSPKVLLYDVPVAYLESKFSNGRQAEASRNVAPEKKAPVPDVPKTFSS